MYIRVENGEHVLVQTIEGPDGAPMETILAELGEDPELNLFFAAQAGRRNDPDAWEGVHDFHLLQALENHKRRAGRFKPALVALDGGRDPEDPSDEPED